MNTALAINNPDLSLSARSIQAAMKSTMIKECDSDELLSLVKGWQREALTIMGQGKGMTHLEGLAIEKETLSMLQSDCRDLAISEIQYLIQKGARGNFNTKEVAYSVRALCSWVAAYREEKRKAIHEMNNKPQIEAPEENQSTTPEEMLKHLEAFYQSWLALKEGEVLGNYIGNFRFAWRLNLLRFSDVAMWRYANKAIETLGAEYAVQKQSRYRHERLKGVSGGHLLENIDREKSIDALPEAVKTEAGRLALIEWFEHLKETESSPSKQMQEQ